MPDMSDLEHTLTSRNISPTAMRLRVLEYLRSRDAAVSLADVEQGLTHTDRVTVYRTLKTFEEHCLVHSIEDGTGATKYALCEEQCQPGGRHHDFHLHFYCKRCAATSCLPHSTIPFIQLPENYVPEEMHFTVKGICAKCTGAGLNS